ncbi:MAG TPA: D-cysteine desulfhydrase family protein [Thermotogota bacterium]|jgi:D-cysteine desulfhydrase|nr:D-cysteine desulfhydrase family protein [Thermotogota bacterium]NLH18721.1 D-cysteine desulfhydrase family protein [Thermotogaceae bacterium]OQC31353.1 MAG: D-cysteine desulfhydrase [Thermotogota bacterium ADurb.Bin062]HNW46923.1 D-cysteine desulfhydrase family protein [Thermotogota bacterium]HNY82657.1 D-cysteine desulfhydrase family protein [Thermotogota bacterium]
MKLKAKRKAFAQLPTPITTLTQYVEGLTVEVKRDDLTHFLASGNKIRKLEYLFQEAIDKGCRQIVTCGGIQSNHCRATAVMCRENGIKPILFLRGQNPPFPEGNLLIDHLLDAEIHWITSEQYAQRDRLMEEFRLKQDHPEGLYIIPEGGSNALGAMGYAQALLELKAQTDLESLEGIFVPIGSGGTYAGILSALEGLGSKVPVYGINVTKTPSEEFAKRIIDILKEMERRFHMPLAEGYAERVRVLDDYVGEGYAIPTAEGLEQLRSLVSKTGILLDPVYTSKCFAGMLDICRKNALRRVLFWHTGGGFSIYAYSERILKGV